MIRRGRSEGWLALRLAALKPWTRLNGASFEDVTVDELPGRGSGVVCTAGWRGDKETVPLMTVPRDLILVLDSVKQYARLDSTLGDLLAGLGDFGDTARGAILTFLLSQATLSCPDVAAGGFVRTPFTDYVKFLPLNDLPTSWTDVPELSLLLEGTTLGPALSAKMNSLHREFDLLKDASSRVAWCARHWWRQDAVSQGDGDEEEARMKRLLETLGEERDSDDEGEESRATGDAPSVHEGLVTFDDWLQVDNFYRSRALEFPGIGDAMVPVIDMANHASGAATTALYESDASGNAMLVLREGQQCAAGDEVTITYGDAKGACEMLFSYGFLEDGMEDARELFLELDVPADDPLAMAKRHVAKSPPGFKVFRQGNDGALSWDGPFVWLVVVNEEDGLDFRVLQTTGGGRELRVFWKDEELPTDGSLEEQLRQRLEADADMWDVFQLRAISILHARVESQIEALESSGRRIADMQLQKDDSRVALILKLRELEDTLLHKALDMFEQRRNALLESAAVVRYLSRSQDTSQEGDDDFT